MKHCFSLPAASFSEVCDWCQLSVYWSASEPSVVEVLHCLVSVLLLLELHVHVPHQMISEVVTHIHLLNRSILVFTLHKHILEEVVIVLL